MLRVAFLCIAVVTATTTPDQKILHSEWEIFKATHNKTYQSSEEEAFRFKIFAEHRIMIARHNEKYSKGLVSYKMDINRFADMLSHEFVQLMNGYGGNDSASHGSTFRPPASLESGKLPETVDWRKQGAVTPVKNQGSCQSCWAFSATGSIEAHTFLKTGKLVSLSEQNLIDCSRSYGNGGCKGGLMSHAFDYVKNNSGIDTEKSYPYEGIDGTCRFKKEGVGATVRGFVRIPKRSEKLLQMAVGAVGPVSVAIDAMQSSFQFYKEGVYDDPGCSNSMLDHGVLVVGYGVMKGKKYWLVKNSWGDGWGQHGYIYMSRDKDNQCGIATDALYPLV